MENDHQGMPGMPGAEEEENKDEKDEDMKPAGDVAEGGDDEKKPDEDGNEAMGVQGEKPVNPEA